MKVFLDSVGCRLNQSEIDLMAYQFLLAGHQIIEDASQADLVIINTCAVTAAASSDSRQKIRQVARKGQACIIPTGCWATIDPQTALKMQGVVKIIPNDGKDKILQNLIDSNIVKIIKKDQRGEKSLRHRKRTRAFIKVQDGCNNHCSYCITRIARGNSRSRNMNLVIADVQAAVAEGVKEVVLTGAQLGSWGRDLFPQMKLIALLRAIMENTAIDRVRLSSIEPWEVNDEFFYLFENPRFCRHLHLPLQSGSSSILQRMQRPIDAEKYIKLVSAINQYDQNIAVTTDLIVGFPGETDEDFYKTLELIQRVHFAGGHVFPFSPRPQTLAASMSAQVLHSVIKDRSRQLRERLADSSFHFCQSQKNINQKVLWEKSTDLGNGYYELEGLSDNYLRLKTVARENLWNHISTVKITNIENKIIYGVISSNKS